MGTYGIPEDSYEWVGLDLGIKLPALFLATYYSKDFKSKKEWKHIRHQVGGIGCEQFYFTGKILKPKIKTLNAMQIISDKWKSCNTTATGDTGVSLDDVLKYREQLANLLGCDCKHSYSLFRSGLYPIDFSPEILRKLCTNKLPEEMPSKEEKWVRVLSDFFVNKKGKQRELEETVFRWDILILGENNRS